MPNFVKDQNEVKEIELLFLQNIEFLKTLYIVRSAMSNYPVIRWLNFAPFIHDMNLIEPNFEMTTVDRIFISVTKNLDKELHGILPEKDMSRYMFYESLVRIAFYKYKMNGTEATTLDGVKKLV